MFNNRFYQKTDTDRKRQARARAGDAFLNAFIDGENINIDLLSPSQNDIYDEQNFDEQQKDSSGDNTDDDDDDLQELFNVLDVNREKKLYSSSSLSIYDACMEIVRLSHDLNLNKCQIKCLLAGLHILLSNDNKLPRTVPGLMKLVGIGYSKKVNYFCRECFYPLFTPQQKECTTGCSMNNQRRPFKNVSELVINDVKKEITTTTKTYLNLIREYPTQSSTLLPCDVLNGEVYTQLPSKFDHQLTLALHTDQSQKWGASRCGPFILGAWLGGTHPNRDFLWDKIVQQIYELLQSGIKVTTDNDKQLKFSIRVQYATFDLTALAQNCNIIQFNGYYTCSDCTIQGVAIGRQIFYPYSPVSSPRKTDHDYLTLSTQNLPAARAMGIKGPTPLTKLLLFPDQVAKHYMHLVCSGHFKTLITYWERILLPGVFD
ncbi:unnamed protein product, partial [Didymodactylos carnosus]